MQKRQSAIIMSKAIKPLVSVIYRGIEVLIRQQSFLFHVCFPENMNGKEK